MRYFFNHTVLSASCLMFFALSVKAQQLKLGNNPTFIYPSAVLQLDSKNQGLLLSRVPDTGNVSNVNTINYFTPPDGMIIYFTDSNKISHVNYGPHAGVYERKSGYWQLLTGITSLNGSTVSVQTFDTGRAGTDFNIVTSTGTGVHTFNLPDAASRIRGVMDTGTQTIGGVKTIDSHYADSSGLAFANMNKSSPVKDTSTGLVGVNSSGHLVRADVQRTFSYPTRSFNNSYQINNGTLDAYVSYSVSLTVTITLLGANTSEANLQISSDGTNWTTISTANLTFGGALTVSVGLKLSENRTISGWVPKGDHVRIITSGTVSYVNGQEVSMQ